MLSSFPPQPCHHYNVRYCTLMLNEGLWTIAKQTHLHPQPRMPHHRPQSQADYTITDIFLSWHSGGFSHLTLEYVKFLRREGIYRRHTLIWKSAWFLCKLHRKMLHISELRGSPKVNLLSAAWNCLHNILSNSISCKQVSTIKGNYCGSQVCLADRPGTLSLFLLDMWHLLRYQQISPFFFLYQHTQSRHRTSVLLHSKHITKHIPIGFTLMNSVYLRPE